MQPLRAANEGDRGVAGRLTLCRFGPPRGAGRYQCGVVAPGSDVLRFSERRLPAMPDSARFNRQLGRLGGGLSADVAALGVAGRSAATVELDVGFKARRAALGGARIGLRLGLYRRRRLDTCQRPGLKRQRSAQSLSLAPASSARLAAARQFAVRWLPSSICTLIGDRRASGPF